ncbi:phosphoglycolate phosphatase [Lentibacillus halophilus]|uniref:Phosphoglycolate phosphatase n=1 Tax=Lentibacillus halophilus TaxID=295065 RepID=A0ABN0ZGD3_9BACI
MDVKLIALDMDGTLLTKDETISELNRKRIAEALANDVRVVLCTGRWYESCLSYAQLLQLDSYLITCNGGEIQTVDNNLIERHLLQPERVRMMWELCNWLDVNTWMVSTDNLWQEEGATDFSKHDWLKFGCDSLDTDKLNHIISELSHYDDLELTNSLPTNIEVNPKGVSKASALERVCHELGITMQHVLAMGDSLNDMKMIQAAGIGVAVGNAQKAIRQAADYVTDTNEQDGVGKAIETFVL